MAMGRVLLVGGSDSSGGAGLEAGQRVVAAHGCYAMTATTALTAQDTCGVRAMHVVPGRFVQQQMEACLDDMGAHVVVTGMLATAETIEVTAAQVSRRQLPVIVDPVMVATSGTELLAKSAVQTLVTRLLPLTTLLTPNLPEARLLVGEGSSKEVQCVGDMEHLARQLQALGPRWVLVKGGHQPLPAAAAPVPPARRDDDDDENNDDENNDDDENNHVGASPSLVVVNVLVGPNDFVLHVHSPWLPTSSTHGTGCTLAAAVAAHLALGHANDDEAATAPDFNDCQLPAAVRAASRYVEAAIRAAPGFGRGHGPLGHLHSTYSLPFAPGYFVEYLLNRPDVSPVWQRFLHHPFVRAIGDASLPLDSFKRYIVQDYLFLTQYARAYALAAYKAQTVDDISNAAAIMAHIERETALHLGYCQSFGISLTDLETTPEHQACTAYTRYALDIGHASDALALRVALLPCLLGYAAISTILSASPRTVRGHARNPYWRWIQNYRADGYSSAVNHGSRLIEHQMRLQSPSRIEDYVKIFIHATRMEMGFWDMFPCH